ncbi:MAG: bifunctional phosphopantothenoylcysteine decarboxylase/phosphopantothenate--cysteine ligase CoaBC [Prochlorotrichaceae cyanobacterium]
MVGSGFPDSPWRDRQILLGIGGGIAAYKLAEVASTLAKNGAQVRAILTEQAERFITPLTLGTLCRHPTYGDADFWHPAPLSPTETQPQHPLHIALGAWAEVILLAPLTANTLAKLTYGLADNLLTNTILASTCPVVLAPAMNTDMWLQQTVQRNWQEICQNDRYHGIAPDSGLLACDRVGIGRMADPQVLLSYGESLLYTQGKRDLQGQHILVTAGATREYLDPVRFLSNPATGRMGIALAEAAIHRGAAGVTLIQSGLLETTCFSPGIQSVAVKTAAEMQQALETHFPQHQILLMAAAVGDVQPQSYSGEKLPKVNIPNPLPLRPVPDLLATLSALKQPHQRMIGFAAQTGDIATPAWDKLQRKGLDGIVANPVDQPYSGFGSAYNQGILIDAQGQQCHILPCTKLALAHRIYDWVLQLP